MSRILITGGTGYIGAHTAVSLMAEGHEIVIVDDLSNSREDVLGRIRQIAGEEPVFYPWDVCDRAKMREVFAAHAFDGVMHFAGRKAVGESHRQPLDYYRTNLDGALTILDCMGEAGVPVFVFSSSATVYGEDRPYPYREDMGWGRCTSPYGWSKAMIEQVVTDVVTAHPAMSAVLLRYYNPIGAHPSGLLGEDPQGAPNNLMPLVVQVASGQRDRLTVFGDDYDTPDGTCRRDYLHVMDLAEGHVAALRYAQAHAGVEAFNLGTGHPYSVLEVVRAFEEATGQSVPYEIGPRRAGDLPEFWADVTKAKELLGWEARRSLDEMCLDSWRWQQR